ncbi:GNAT family N-acetyltransferase [Curtobacterium sp. 458]|uniref:GNAT family N-acetyltransferase n=1 Tax=Curtobacterium sp. 458 TaxID=3050069 RepID=UPI0025B2FC10|nr:GNAT family N-acetyltransferase [Curtobacterium sp. 458]WJX99325.1 GNAT family N-acetyltransferase [Curtobacterium sp. 458]
MTASITVRPAVLEDAERIAFVHATSWRETYGRFVEDPDHSPWFAVEPRIAMWRTNLTEHTYDTVVALDGDDLVGFAGTHATPPSDGEQPVRPEELTMLYVLARAHGSGAGQALLDAALGHRSASLWVAEDNPRAQAFYRRNGFTADGATSSFGPIERSVRMVR